MTYDRQRAILDRALDDLASGVVPVSRILEQCGRLAHLRKDYPNLWWIRLELSGIDGGREFKALEAEMRSYFGSEFSERKQAVVLDFGERRRTEEGKVAPMGIGPLENDLAHLESVVRAAEPPQGLHPLDLYYANERYQKTIGAVGEGVSLRREILSRVRTRTARFLSETEAALEFGQVATGTFERVRKVVDARLAEVAPDALTKFRAAYDRAATGDAEARSQALGSCRRILVSLADALYPATGATVVGPDGRSHVMSADLYRNRLWQYVAENAAGGNARRLTQATVEEIGGRLDRIDALASQGVHGDVTAAEVDQCVVQTYLLAGDLLRLVEPVAEV